MKGVLFDLDETLIDRNQAIAAFVASLWHDYFARSDISQASLLAAINELDQFGYRTREQFFSLLWQAFSSYLPDQQVVENTFYGQVWETPVLAEGVLECLDQLQRKNIPLGIVTNGSTRAQSAKIKHSGLLDYFGVVVVSEDFGVKKPDPSIYTAATRQLQVKPDDCWFIGDHPVNDIWGSKQLGFRTGWIHRGRPWDQSVKACYDLKGESFIETMTQVMAAPESFDERV